MLYITTNVALGMRSSSALCSFLCVLHVDGTFIVLKNVRDFSNGGIVRHDASKRCVFPSDPIFSLKTPFLFALHE